MKARICQRCRAIVVGECSCKKPQASTAANGYGRRWQAFRMRVFMLRVKQGRALCAACGKAFGSESPHGDHIVPVMDESDPLFYEESNIQFLHPSCHGRKTQGDVKRGLTR